MDFRSISHWDLKIWRLDNVAMDTVTEVGDYRTKTYIFKAAIDVTDLVMNYVFSKKLEQEFWPILSLLLGIPHRELSHFKTLNERYEQGPQIVLSYDH